MLSVIDICVLLMRRLPFYSQTTVFTLLAQVNGWTSVHGAGREAGLKDLIDSLMMAEAERDDVIRQLRSGDVTRDQERGHAHLDGLTNDREEEPAFVS
jgi:hypothetical protein